MNGGTGLRFRSFVVTSLDDERLSLGFRNDLAGVCLIVDQDLVLLKFLIETAGFDSLLTDLEQTRIERRRKFRAEVSADGPILVS